MATNNVVELKVKVIDETSGALSRIHGALDALSQKFLGVGINAVASFAVIVKGFEKIYEESTQAELAAVRFNAAFDALGKGIRLPREELEKFAIAAQQSTRFSDENVKEAQAVLLRFGDVTGVVFQRAQKLTLDLAEAMGGDAASAAQFLGRALENPIQAGRLLRQVGVFLTASQKEQVQAFLESGHQMEAQKIILDELSKRYDGLAQKIGDTTAGKVTELRHAFEDLFKVQGSFGPFKDAVVGLTAAISDPELKKSIQDVFTLFVKLVSDAIVVLGVLVQLVAKLGNAAQTAFGWMSKITTLSGADQNFRSSRPSDVGAQISSGVRVAPTVDLSHARGGGMAYAGPGDYSQPTQTDKDTIAQEKKDAAWALDLAHLQQAQELQDGIDKMVQQTTDDIRSSADATGDVTKNIELSVKITESAYNKLGQYSKAQIQAIGDIQSAFADMFHSVGSGINGMLQAFLHALEEMVIQAAAAHLTDYLFGAVDEQTGKRSGGTDWGSALISGVGALFGGALFGFASGGDAPAGLKLVGESGPELISSGPARIWNSQQLADVMGAGGGGVSYAPATTINVEGSMDKATEGRIYAYIEATRAKDQREMMRTLQRNGMRNIR